MPASESYNLKAWGQRAAVVSDRGGFGPFDVVAHAPCAFETPYRSYNAAQSATGRDVSHRHLFALRDPEHEPSPCPSLKVKRDYVINFHLNKIRKRSVSFRDKLASANMYKTVRHGENSLQYTILPQTEEVLNNSGLKGKGRDYSPSIHVRRSRRKYKWQLTLVLLLALIIAFALLCVSIYSFNPAYFDRWFRRNDRDTIVISSAVPTVMRESSNSRKKELKISPELFSTLDSRLEASLTTPTKTYATTTTFAPTVSSAATGEKSTTPPWIMPALRSWKSSSTIQTIPTERNDVPIVDKFNSKQDIKEKTDIDNMSIKPWEKDNIIRPTIAPESNTLRDTTKYHSFVPSERPAVTTTKMFDDVLITAKGTTTRAPLEITTDKLRDIKDAVLSMDDDDEFEVEGVFPLPPLKPDSGVVNGDSDEVTVSKADGGWYGARWPFVDTSSYFQWTGYSPGDNLLLLLLVAALCSIALVLLLALALRRRNRSHSHTAQIGKLTSELAADDNTNLLTAENGEDAEE